MSNKVDFPIEVAKKFKLRLLDLLYKANSKVIYSFLRNINVEPVRNVILDINNICNYDCLYCGRDRASIGLSRGKWLSLISEIRESGIKNVTLLGGNPLLSSWFYEILERINAEKFSSIRIISNGSLLTAENLKKLKRYNPTLIVEYGIPSSLYKKITGQSNYSLESIKDNIKRSVNLGFKVITSSVLKSYNVDKVDKIVCDSLEMGAFPVFERYFSFENFPDLSETTKNKYKHFFITQNDFEKAVANLDYYFSRYKKPLLAALRATQSSVCG